MTADAVINLVFKARNRAENETRQVKRDLEQIRERAEAAGRAGRAIATRGAALSAGVTLPVVAFGSAALGVTSQFDGAMREVNSLLGLSQEGFQDLSDDVRKLSVELGTDLTKNANAAYQAISAGVSEDNAIEFLRTANKAAIAGVTDVTTAVDGLTTVLNAWDIEASKVEQVSDVLFATVKSGKTTMDELSRSMFQAAPLAAEMGVSLEEVGAATATLTKSGTPTSVAMTQLRQAMVALQKPTAQMETLLEKAGISNVQAAVETDGLAATYERLRAAAEGDELAGAVGSVEALNAVLGITGEKSAVFREDLERMQNSAGSMQEAFEENDAAIGRSFEKLKAKFQSLAVTIGGVLAEPIQKIARSLGRFTSWVERADPKLVRLGVAIAAVAATVGPLLAGLGLMVTAGSALVPVLAAVAGVGFAPLLGIVAGVAAVVAYMVAVWKTVGPVVGKAVEWVKRVVAEWVAQNGPLLQRISGAWEKLKDAAGKLFAAIRKAFTQITTAITTELDQVMKPFGGLDQVMKATMTVAGLLLEKFLSMAAGVLSAAADHLPSVVQHITKVIRTVGSFVRAVVELPAKARAALGDLAGGVKEKFDSIKHSIKGGIDALKFWDDKGEETYDRAVANSWMTDLADGIAERFRRIKAPVAGGIDDMDRFTKAGEKAKRVGLAGGAAAGLMTGGMAAAPVDGGFGGGIGGGIGGSSFAGASQFGGMGGGYGGGIHQLSEMARLQQDMTRRVRETDLAAAGMQGTYRGLQDSIAGLVEGTMTWQGAVSNVAQSILSELVSSFATMAAAWITEHLAMTATVQSSNAATAASAAPAAALQSTVSYGAAPTIGAAAVLAALATVAGAFREGGYTGTAGIDSIAGVVHGREYVSNAETTARNREFLEYLNRGGTAADATDAARETGRKEGGQPVNVFIVDSASKAQSMADDVEGISRIVAREEIERHRG